MICDVMLGYVMLCCGVLCYVFLRYAILLHMVLLHGMLVVVLCYAMLPRLLYACCAMPCYAVSHLVVPWYRYVRVCVVMQWSVMSCNGLLVWYGM